MNTIEIRPLTTLIEMRAAAELQKVFWGDNLEATVPAHMLYSLATHGGHVLAAFDGQRIVGVLIDFLGTDASGSVKYHLQLVSKRMVVLSEYRGQGVGYQLKCEQRKYALQQGLDLVTWTFDPLMALNAHLNIHKLGAISRTYLEDYYGTGEEGGLATLGSSDRLLAEWWVKDVEDLLAGKAPVWTFEEYLQQGVLIANATNVNPAGYAVPPVELCPSEKRVMLEIPVNYTSIVQNDPELAKQWRSHTRDLFERFFSLKYRIMDFSRLSYEGRDRAFYQLLCDS